MAKSIALSDEMDVLIFTINNSIAEFSLTGNGVRIEMVNQELQVTLATSVPSSGSVQNYPLGDAQYTMMYNKDNEILGVIGIDDLINQKNTSGGAFDLSNKAYNVRQVGTNLVISEYP